MTMLSVFVAAPIAHIACAAVTLTPASDDIWNALALLAGRT